MAREGGQLHAAEVQHFQRRQGADQSFRQVAQRVAVKGEHLERSQGVEGGRGQALQQVVGEVQHLQLVQLLQHGGRQLLQLAAVETLGGGAAGGGRARVEGVLLALAYAGGGARRVGGGEGQVGAGPGVGMRRQTPHRHVHDQLRVVQPRAHRVLVAMVTHADEAVAGAVVQAVPVRGPRVRV